MLAVNIFLIWLPIVLVNSLEFKKPVTEMKWRGKCKKNERALNDCNWCHCTSKSEFSCNARICAEVDMFGHFNDAIREYDPGMGGHGAWRSKTTACEPNVHYRRTGLHCVCNEDGNWPNPVCRDIFRVLHTVEVTGMTAAKGQECQPNKLYLIGCNVCLCSSSSSLDPESCTKMKCTQDDPILQQQTAQAQDSDQEADSEEDSSIDEFYAKCTPDFSYKIGCKTCKCLRNNRLLCNQCIRTNVLNDIIKSYCVNEKDGLVFSRDCNLCYCLMGYAHCSTKKCLRRDNEFTEEHALLKVTSKHRYVKDNCVPGVKFQDDCNECYCIETKPHNMIACTMKVCGRSKDLDAQLQDCVEGTMYELNCLICHCDVIDGAKIQTCQVNPMCQGKQALDEKRTDDLDSLHGYCEPMHTYRHDCNTCKCMTDGKTVRCTSYICEKRQLDPISVDIVPVHQDGASCPKGLSYKIDCNYCFCLPNGNALCTTAKCGNKIRN